MLPLYISFLSNSLPRAHQLRYQQSAWPFAGQAGIIDKRWATYMPIYIFYISPVLWEASPIYPITEHIDISGKAKGIGHEFSLSADRERLLLLRKHTEPVFYGQYFWLSSSHIPSSINECWSEMLPPRKECFWNGKRLEAWQQWEKYLKATSL